MGSTVSLPVPSQPTTGADKNFVQSSVPNVVSFDFVQVTPPSQLYIQRDDVLVIMGTTQNAPDNVVITARILLPFAQAPGQPDAPPKEGIAGGPIVGPGYIQTLQFILAIPVARQLASIAIPLLEGYLLSLTAWSNTSPSVGNTFVRAQLNRGAVGVLPGNVFALLLSGYVTQLGSLFWPGGQVIKAADGPGFLQTYAVGYPAAGVDFTFTTNQVGRARFAAAIATLTCGAGAANRFVSFQLGPQVGGTVQYQVQDTVAVTANQTVTYSLSPGGQLSRGGGTPSFVTLPAPAPLFDKNAIVISSSTQNIQAADQWSAIRVYTEEWLEGF